MYPDRLEIDAKQRYFSEEEYFDGKFNFIHTYLHKNYNNKMHSHQFYEINIIMKGEGRHYIESMSIEASVGDVFVIPPETAHGYKSLESMDIFHVLIKNDFFARYAEELSEIEGFDMLFDIEPHIRKSVGGKLNFRCGPVTLTEIDEDLKKMNETEKSGRYVYLNMLTMALICKLCEKCGEAVQAFEGDTLGVIAYINNNTEGKITVKALSEYAHMSAPTLNRRFKAAVGMSPMEYVIYRRVQKAKKLIAKGGLKRSEIAQLCGFYDAAHMNKYIRDKRRQDTGIEKNYS